MDCREAITKLGRKQVMTALGVSSSQVSNALRDGAFPAHWFDVMDRMAAAQAWQLPRCLFNWRRAKAAAAHEKGAAA